jgi:geranylgeranyl diphosphate synthase type I
MKVPEYVKQYKGKINNAIEKIWDLRFKEVRNSFLIDYYKNLKEYFLAGGKRLRPLLCIATYNAFNSEKDDNIIDPSVGVEFLHNASLIHDDIIDKDNFRRGQPAFHYIYRKHHKKNKYKIGLDHFGNTMGILGGDTAYFFGLEAFLNNNFEVDKNIKAIKYYKKAFEELCEGVLIEIEILNRHTISMDEYIEMISLKTGALIEKSVLIGANYAEADNKYYQNLSNYAKNLGIIFQIIDDILGTFGDEEITGKPTDGDIREGKKTCLLIEALNVLDENKKKRILNLVGNDKVSKNSVQEVKDLFTEANVVESCRNIANKYVKIARGNLENLKSDINESEYEFYENLLKYVIEREF